MTRCTPRLPDSSVRTWMASRRGTPARIKAASWRERCISSVRLIRLLVSSSCIMPCFSAICLTSRSRLIKAIRADVRVSASWMPFSTEPSTPAATYANLGIRRSQGVDAADDLGDGRDVVLDQGPCLVAERAHSLLHGELAHLLVRR